MLHVSRIKTKHSEIQYAVLMIEQMLIAISWTENTVKYCIDSFQKKPQP